MRLTIFAAAALVPVTSPAAPADRPPAATAAAQSDSKPTVPKPLKELGMASDCPEVAPYHPVRRGESLRPRKLTELPPAEAYHAALRLGPDGCPDPVMVGYQYRQDR